MSNLNIKKVFFWFINILLTVFIVSGVIILFSKLPLKNNINVYSVQSGSMEPSLKTGSMIIVYPLNSYKINDIITFRSNEEQMKTNNITHRIFEIENVNGNIFYVTKGDANDSQDNERIVKSQIIGKVMLGIPYMGYLVNFIKTLAGLIVLIIVPSLIIIYEEINNIKKETKNIINKRKLNS